ncbi:MAG: gamma-glutamyltransferase [Polyangiaceae bacterium]
MKVLEDGGNAIDAAVATAYALAVTHPSAGNLGGGGFMIVRLKTGETYAIDFRETAPAAATTKKVVDEIKAGAFGWASVAIPGTVAGLDLAREKFGTKPLADLLAPAIKLAKKGHKVTARAAMSLKAQWSSLEKDPAARAIWGKKKGPLKAGDKVVQADLAKTLEAIAEKGDAGFYDGPVADLIDAAMKKNGGDVTKDELKTYKAKLREPLRFSYRGFTIDTMPPPSMGGVAVAETLLQLERAGASDAPLDSTRFFHLFVEAAKRSYADRRIVGADPDFYGDKVSPGALERLLGARYLVYREPKIDPDKATPATAFEAASDHKESPETTHFSVVDAEGNAVSCTVTLSASFGSKVMAPGTGFFFSNALGAFSETGSNEVAPHKRMASSMSPTVLSRDGKVEAVVGSPGGDTIPNTVAQVIRNLVDYHMTVDEAVLHGRVHHQLLPDVIRYEVGRDPPANVIKELEKLGHKLEGNAIPLGDAKIIVRDPATGEAWGFADPREGGLALGPP